MSFHINTRQAAFLCLLAATLVSVSAKKLEFKDLFTDPGRTFKFLRVNGFNNRYNWSSKSTAHGFEWSEANGRYFYNKEKTVWAHESKLFEMSEHSESGKLTVQRIYANIPETFAPSYKDEKEILQVWQGLNSEGKKALKKHLCHSAIVGAGFTLDFKNDNFAMWTRTDANGMTFNSKKEQEASKRALAASLRRDGHNPGPGYNSAEFDFKDKVDFRTVSSSISISANMDAKLHNDLAEAMDMKDFQLLLEEGEERVLERLRLASLILTNTHRFWKG